MIGQSPKRLSKQSRVARWLDLVFTEAEIVDWRERVLRFVEEAIELAQAVHLDAATLHRLVDYVYSRPVGEVSQEVAGCLVTLYAAAHSLGVDSDEVFEDEFKRIHRPEVLARIRRRQSEKRAADGSV